MPNKVEIDKLFKRKFKLKHIFKTLTDPPATPRYPRLRNNCSILIQFFT